jgi:hypothetical protein
MGSTSYDEARDINDPTWSGASWYGPSSGEYWIVNPREYADPRKHGPEYQSRARRPLPGDAPLPDPEAPSATATETPPASTTAWATGASGAGADAAAESPRWGSSPSASSWTVPVTDRAVPRDRGVGRAGLAGEGAGRRGAPTAGSPGPVDVEAASRGSAGTSWLGGPADDPIRRLGFALVAWPPIGLAAAALIASATGCGSATASCGGAEPLLPLLAQAGILGALLLLAPLARILAGGALGMLVAVVPLTLLLVAIGGTGVLQAGLAPAALLVVAWLVGVAWAASRAGGRGRPRATRGSV